MPSSTDSVSAAAHLPTPAEPSPRWLVGVAGHAAALGLMALAYPRVGTPAALFGILAILLTGARAGARAGIASGVVIALGQLVVLLALDSDLLARIVGEWRGMGALLFVGLGALVGRVSDLHRTAQERAAELTTTLADLDRSRAGLEALFEQVDTAFWVLDADLRLRTANRRFQRNWQQLRGHPLAIGERPVESGPDCDAWTQHYRRALAGDVVFAEVHREDDDAPQHYDVTLSPIRLPDGTIDGVMGFARDVAPRERAEARYRALVAGAPDAIIVHRRGTVVSANPAAVALFAASDTPALLGRALDALAPPDDGNHRAGRPGTQRRRVDRPEGEPIHLEAADVDLGEGATLTFLHDVSERDALETRLRLTDRMATVGTLAAGVAHEINNPLAYLIANLDWLGGELERLGPRLTGDEHAELDAVLHEMRDGAGRVGRIVRDLSLFARPETAGACSVDLHGVLDRALTLTGTRLPEQVEVQRAYGAKSRPFCNEGHLAQVLLNVLVNAADSMSDPGSPHRLTIRTRDEPNGGVRVEVADTGVGIPPEALPRVYEPFFRARREGNGAGLGLSISHTLIESMGGAITLHSSLDRGTRVTLTLPGRPSSAETDPSSPAEPRLRVLVIDDEPLVLRAVARGLRPHEVATFGDAEAGLEAALTQDFDVVLCDTYMPVLDGIQILETLKAERPALAARLVLMTGGSFTDADSQRLAACGVPVLAKPFGAESLREAVTARLTGAPQPTER